MNNSLYFEKIGAIDNTEILVFDTETTGLSKDKDDILQFSAIDGNGNALMNQLFHPVRKTAWPHAQAVNHISPQMVADAPLINDHAEKIMSLFRKAKLIVAYNVKFDYNMLLGNLPAQRGELCHIMKYSKKHCVYDVMWHFPPVYASTHENANPQKPQKLHECAAHYGYSGDKFHDALEDCRATLYCFFKVVADEKKLGLSS